MKKLITFVFALMTGMAMLYAQGIQNQHYDELATVETLSLYASPTVATDSYCETLKDVSFPTENDQLYLLTELKKNPDKLTASLLSILLGNFGVGHFYTGQTVRGVLDILFCWTGIPAIIGLIEGIVWLCEDDDAWAERVAEWNSK